MEQNHSVTKRIEATPVAALRESRPQLQVQVLETAAARFVSTVIKPALTVRRGEPRLRDLFERWLDWEGRQRTPGGCIFVQASVELDDREGPARDRLVQLQKDWLGVMATTVRGAISERHFRRSIDPDQFAHDLNGIMLAYHHAARLLKDRAAEQRARTAFEALVRAARSSRRS